MTLAFSENIHKAVLFSWSWNEEVYIRQKRHDGVFAMLTNHAKENVCANEILFRYRDRNQIEMNFRDLKGLLDLERIFIQIPERIDAYLLNAGSRGCRTLKPRKSRRMKRRLRIAGRAAPIGQG